MGLDMNKLFPPKEVKKVNYHPKKTYDIKITLNDSGKGKKQVIRYGFINKAGEEAKKHGFAEVSDIEYCKTRLYFRFHDSKNDKRVHKLTASKSTNGECGTGFYFCETPSDKAKKLYLANWLYKKYKLQWDEENKLYFIENTKEVTA